MANSFRFNIEGAKELDKTLQAFPKKMQASSQGAALRAGGKVLLDEMKQQAPVDTGELKQHLTLSKKRQRRDTKDNIAYKVGTTRETYYGKFLEYGTKDIPSRPWMRPAFDVTKEQVLKTILLKLRDELIKNAQKLAGPLAKSGLVSRKRR